MSEIPDKNRDDLGSAAAVPSPVFIEIKSVPLRSSGRDMRLREGDVIVAVDGLACHLDITEFENLLLDALDDESSVFVTIGRDEMFFEIFLTGPLGLSLDYTDAQRAVTIAEQFANHSVGPKEQYQTYELVPT